MGIKDHGLRRSGRPPLSINDRWDLFVGRFEQLGIQPAPLHFGEQVLGVSADVYRVGSDVRDGKEAEIFGKELVFVGLAIRTTRILRKAKIGEKTDKKKRSKFHTVIRPVGPDNKDTTDPAMRPT